MNPTPCEICRATTTLLFSARDYRRPHDKKEFHLGWCANCDFGRIAGQFTRGEVGEFYETAYYTHGAPDGVHGTQSLLSRLILHLAWRVDHGVDFTPDDLGAANNRTLCDIGCGNGENLQRLADAGFRVVGIEPDPVARIRAGKVAEVFDGTAEVLPAQVLSERFDVVLLSHVLEHCIDVRASLSNIRSILSPTGVAIIEVPNSNARGFAMYGAEWPMTDLPRHLNFFTARSLRTILELEGFSVERSHYVGYARQFLPDWTSLRTDIQKEIGVTGSRRALPVFLWLAYTAFTFPEKKYDSVRVFARPTS